MKFVVKPTGQWDRIHELIRFWPQRAEAFQHRVVLDFAKKFRKLVRSRIPKDNELTPYKKHLVLRKLRGAFTKGEFGYALIADPRKLELKSISPYQNVVFVIPGEGTASDLAILLVEHSPWVIDMLPKNMNEIEGVSLVHRKVTEEEVAKIREENKKTISKHKSDFDLARATFKPAEEPMPPKTMPDVVFMAVRLEFGIYGPQKRHWGYAARQQDAILKEMADDRVYGRYLNDVRYTQWKKPRKKLKPLPVQMFKTLYAEFQDKVKPG